MGSVPSCQAQNDFQDICPIEEVTLPMRRVSHQPSIPLFLPYLSFLSLSVTLYVCHLLQLSLPLLHFHFFHSSSSQKNILRVSHTHCHDQQQISKILNKICYRTSVSFPKLLFKLEMMLFLNKASIIQLLGKIVLYCDSMFICIYT